MKTSIQVGQHTKMMSRYLFKLGIRVSIFLGVLCFYLFNKDMLWSVAVRPLYRGVNPIHLLWLLFMLIMLKHIFPTEKLTMALRKAEAKQFQPVEGYAEYDLLRFVQDQNIKAWKVMLVWLIFNALFGILYLFGILDEADLLMLTVFFFLCDYICILFFCPFQTFIMKNRCCINCRIYDWGAFHDVHTHAVHP